MLPSKRKKIKISEKDTKWNKMKNDSRKNIYKRNIENKENKGNLKNKVK
jgi:hypothetical protein